VNCVSSLKKKKSPFAFVVSKPQVKSENTRIKEGFISLVATLFPTGASLISLLWFTLHLLFSSRKFNQFQVKVSATPALAKSFNFWGFHWSLSSFSKLLLLDSLFGSEYCSTSLNMW